jgi:agmatine deiminase
MVVQPKEIVAAKAAKQSRRWPAEWEPQDAIWFAWPHNKKTWPGHFEPIPSAFAEMVNSVAEFVPAKVLASSGRHAKAARKLLRAEVTLVDIATNDCWIRDYGPTFVHEGNDVIGIDWKFNAWGGKYPPWDDDAAAAGQICNLAGKLRESSKMTLEGGAIEGDGNGRLLTTPVCLRTANRNRGWSRDRIARELHKRLGVNEIVWVEGGGLDGDDTDGHIDQLARFVTPNDVVVAVSSDANDSNARGLATNFAQISAWAEQTSPVVNVHALPTPPPRSIDGQRVPQSYCNFLILADKAIIVPTFGNRKTDQQAMGLLRELRPKSKVIPIDASDFIWGRGAWHCASQQQPAKRT